MVSSMEDSSSEETKYGASWQQDSDEEDLLSSKESSRSPYKRKRTSSLPVIHKKNILAPTYPNVPVVNSSAFQTPCPWMSPPWVQNPWMYVQQMPMMSSPPWTTVGAQPAVMSYSAPWMQVPPPPPWTMEAHRGGNISYNTPWMQVSPTQQDHSKDYGSGYDSQMKKAGKARKHVKNVSNVGRKAKVRKVVKLKKKKKRGNHLSLTETTERLQASLQASQGTGPKKPSRLVGSFAARLSAIENRQNEIEEQLTKVLASARAVSEAIDGLQDKLIEIVTSSITKTTNN